MRNGFSRSGFSLVELMVAITLGLLLTAGMVQLFNSSKVTFRTNDALARVQENGRFAIETLKSELREAGDLGFCAGTIPITNHLNNSCGGGTQSFFDPNMALVAWEYSNTGPADAAFSLPENLDPATAAGAGAGDWSNQGPGSTDLPTALVGFASPWSDVLVIRSLQPIAGLTADDPPPVNNVNSVSMNLNQAHGLPDDALVMVTNCTSADLFQNRTNASSAAFSTGSGSCSNPGPGNQSISSVNWSTAYASDMQAFQVTQVVYYVGVNPATQQPGLYRLNLSNGVVNQQREELVEGVENMQVLFGFSASAPAGGDGESVDQWLTADQVPAAGWRQVIAMRVALSVRSPESADADNTVITLDLSGTDVDAPGDGRIRQPFSATIALRNRVLVGNS